MKIVGGLDSTYLYIGVDCILCTMSIYNGRFIKLGKFVKTKCREHPGYIGLTLHDGGYLKVDLYAFPR